MYIIILAGIVLSVLGKMLNGCSVENSYSEDCYSCGGTNIHEPYSGGSTSSSGRSTYSNPPPVSASSTARSLDAQGYRIGQIRKYLKENGYGDYRRKEIKEMIGK
ncbi:MAG: hypothetical protein COZ18_10205 [Flexibacter sp. CG_4_10_14_3_um_filter_32_15]|nr:MAG: hypothetical protein COZ18_10205 [Flexibacter sp. CG_4_10_14_3_um_filter_32_15]